MYWPSWIRPLGLIPAILFLTSCQSTPPPVPVQGSEASLRLLEGEWEGELTVAGTGQIGEMTFSLVAGQAAAAGDVVLFPLHDSPDDASRADQAIPRPPRVLRINFVRCVAGTVLGAVGPYHDPDCDCMVTTEFQGVVEGDKIVGSFTTWEEESTVPLRGRWEMRRKGS